MENYIEKKEDAMEKVVEAKDVIAEGSEKVIEEMKMKYIGESEDKKYGLIQIWEMIILTNPK